MILIWVSLIISIIAIGLSIYILFKNKENCKIPFNVRYRELDIMQYLKEFRNKKFTFIPNGGNGGDALIAAGTYQLFDRLELNYDISTADIKHNNKLLIYGGGGNFIEKYDYCKTFLKNNLDNENKIIILPHTIKNVDNWINKFDNNVTVICRDKKSYDYVYSLIKNKNNVYLSKDMAFYLDISNYKNKSNGKGTLNYFRNDIERTNISIPINNVDLSEKINYDSTMCDKEKVLKTVYEILDFISVYKVVNTNRLHGGIASSLLQKTVNLYPNSYWKNKAVYEYSLKDKYPKTKFKK